MLISGNKGLDKALTYDIVIMKCTLKEVRLKGGDAMVRTRNGEIEPGSSNIRTKGMYLFHAGE